MLTVRGFLLVFPLLIGCALCTSSFEVDMAKLFERQVPRGTVYQNSIVQVNINSVSSSVDANQNVRVEASGKAKTALTNSKVKAVAVVQVQASPMVECKVLSVDIDASGTLMSMASNLQQNAAKRLDYEVQSICGKLPCNGAFSFANLLMDDPHNKYHGEWRVSQVGNRWTVQAAAGKFAGFYLDFNNDAAEEGAAPRRIAQNVVLSLLDEGGAFWHIEQHGNYRRLRATAGKFNDWFLDVGSSGNVILAEQPADWSFEDAGNGLTHIRFAGHNAHQEWYLDYDTGAWPSCADELHTEL